MALSVLNSIVNEIADHSIYLVHMFDVVLKSKVPLCRSMHETP